MSIISVRSTCLSGLINSLLQVNTTNILLSPFSVRLMRDLSICSTSRDWDRQGGGGGGGGGGEGGGGNKEGLALRKEKHKRGEKNWSLQVEVKWGRYKVKLLRVKIRTSSNQNEFPEASRIIITYFLFFFLLSFLFFSFFFFFFFFWRGKYFVIIVQWRWWWWSFFLWLMISLVHFIMLVC